MPLYKFQCPVCGVRNAKVLAALPETERYVCMVEGCTGLLVRTPTPPNSDFKEVHDNGAMARKVETYPDVQKIMKDRSDADERNRRIDIFTEE
jgi:hydrogenase maturation factor